MSLLRLPEPRSTGPSNSPGSDVLRAIEIEVQHKQGPPIPPFGLASALLAPSGLSEPKT